MQVGFIGLGTMGASVVTNLQSPGYKLVVHDIRQNSATPHVNTGAEWADSPKILAAQCQVIFTSVPSPADVEAVALGLNGLIEGMGVSAHSR
jgi:3-hydroxyisobutyrate dehydrogenase